MTQSKIQIDEISGNKGQINIAEGDINISQERPLTPAEEAGKARLLEQELLEKRVKVYRENLLSSIRKVNEVKEPYKGLYEYEINDADIFFGRAKATESILKALKRGRLMILQSESGAGKTSLLQAGILRRLIQSKMFAIYLRRPYDKTAAECLKQVFIPDPAQAPIIHAMQLNAFLYELTDIIGKKIPTFILIDQFEEFFTVVSNDKQESFIEELAECLDDPGLNVHWLISLRTEYMGQLGKFQPRIHNPFRNSFLLNRLNRVESEEIARKPAERFGLEFEDGLLEEILDDLGKEDIAPPQLQLVCTALFEGLEANQKSLTHNTYQAKGGANGILNGYLENVLKRLSPFERSTARHILEILITSTQKRALRTHTEIVTELTGLGVQSRDANVVLGRLIDSRLLRVSETDTEQVYELAHDYLLNEIKIDEATKKRKQATELLEQGLKNWRSHGLLLGRDALDLINSAREGLHPSDEEIELFIISAIEYQLKPKAWERFLDKEARQRIIERAIQSKGKSKDKKSRQYANDILWFFSTELPTTERGKFLLTEIPRRTLVEFMPKTLRFIFVLAAITMFILLSTLISSSAIEKWKHVSTLDTQCLNGRQDSILKVTIDRKKDSNFAVYDQKSGRLCESSDSGKSWLSIQIPIGMMIENILAMNNNLFVVSKYSIKYKAFGQTDQKEWHDLGKLVTKGGNLAGLAINPKNSDEIIIAAEPDQLFSTDDFGASWTDIKLDIIHGVITGVATDGTEILLATTEGIWYSKYAPIEWIEIKDVPLGQHIHSILIYDKNFYAVLDDKNIYTGDFTQRIMLEGPQAKGEYPMPSWPDTKDDVESLSASGTVILVGNDSGLKCYPRWSFFRREWWGEVFDKTKPCQDDQTQ